MKENILIVIQKGDTADRLQQSIQDALQVYGVEVHIVYDSIEGLIKFRQIKPTLMIIDADMPTLNGFSFVSILQDMAVNCLMYIIVSDETPLLNCSKIDCFFHTPLDLDFILGQLLSVFEKKYMADQKSSQLEKAKYDQKKLLPESVITDGFKVDYIYSPFSELSGDCLDYWFGQDEKGLYGFIFDCTGHDINAFSQVLEIRALFHINFRYYQRHQHNNIDNTLSDVMQNVNEELFRLHGENVACCAGVAFYIDFIKMELHYCSAGIPNFFIRNKNEKNYKEIEMENYLIGYDSEATFYEKKMSLENVDDVIFSTDGFSELLYKAASDLAKAKHDDISAVFIRIKNTKQGVHNKHLYLKEA